MNQTLILILAVSIIISVIGSAFIIAYVMTKKKEREKNMTPGAVHRALPGKEPFAWKRVLPIVFWVFYYSAIGTVILIQCVQGIAGRFPEDIAFLIVPSVFFIIGYSSLHGIRKRRRLSTATAVAKVISISKVSRDSTPYAPVYEFYVNEVPYKVISPARYGTCPVLAGESVEINYDPGQPRTIYVPEYEKRLPLIVIICLFIGIVFPLIALLAPILR